MKAARKSSGSATQLVRRALRHRGVLLRSLLIVTMVRLVLSATPSRVVLRNVWRVARVRANQSCARLPAKRIARAVSAVSKIVPAATCLTQAIAVQLLLARNGYASELEIGVRRALDGAFEAHAWVVCGGEVVIGGRALDGYRRLPAMAMDGVRHDGTFLGSK